MIVPKYGVRTFTMTLANVWGALLMPDTMGLICMSCLRVLIKLYNVGALFSLFTIFLTVFFLLNFYISVFTICSLGFV